MLKVRLIPCLDVKEGRVVKGVNFINLKDAGDPVEIAAAYDEAGADELCFLDITASLENRVTVLEVIRKVANHCFMPLSAGGGVRTLDQMQDILLAGADKVTLNTSAIQTPELIEKAAQRFGSQAVVVALDARQSGSGWEIFTHSGNQATGLDAVDFARHVAELGAGEILITSMDRDGTKSGFDCALIRAIAEQVSVPVIASGGAGTLAHLAEVVKQGKASAVLAASIFHFGEITISEAKSYLAAQNIPVRFPGRLPS